MGRDKRRSIMILEAYKLATQHGVYSVTPADVARAAAVSVKLVYAYVGGRPDIIRAIIEHAEEVGDNKILCRTKRKDIYAKRGSEIPAM